MQFKRITNNYWNVTLYFLILSVVMFILNIMNPAVYGKLFLLKSSDFNEIIPWQFFTYIFYTNPGNLLLTVIFFAFKIMVLMWFCSALEALWGSLRFLIFLVIIILSRSIGAFFIGPLPVYDDFHLYICIMVAFGFNFPDNVIYFFIIPVRVKIMAIISLCAIPLEIFLDLNPINYGLIRIPLGIAAILTGLLSYIVLLIFFGRIFGGKSLFKVRNRMKEIKPESVTKKVIETNLDNNRKYGGVITRYQTDTMTEGDKKAIEEIIDENKPLCNEVDFDENDAYCMGCDKYRHCVKRKINGSRK